jgi:hypothetical protein
MERRLSARKPTLLMVKGEPTLSPYPDLIQELIRAANRDAKLALGQRMDLMARGTRTIREMRLKTGFRPGIGPDPLNALEVAALKSAKGSQEDVNGVLLEIAAMIRALKIAQNGKDKPEENN